MDEKTRQFIRVFFAGVTVDGIGRSLQFEEEPEARVDETATSVYLHRPGSLSKNTVALGFPEWWKPPLAQENTGSKEKETRPVTLPAKLWDAIDGEAPNRGMTEEEFLRNAVECYLEDLELADEIKKRGK